MDGLVLASAFSSRSSGKAHALFFRSAEWSARGVKVCRRRMLNTKGSLFQSDADVFTASRRNASTLRIIGPGSNFATDGLGCLLAVDEFFLHPVSQDERHLIPHQAESLTYFLEATDEKDTESFGGTFLPRHGIHVLFQCSEDNAPDQHANKTVKDAGSVQTIFLDSDNDKGGAKVRVIMGIYEDAPILVQGNFVILDIMMRPGSSAKFPAHASHAVIIYVLEGVGIIKRYPSSRTFYENEGHGVWFPPLRAPHTALDNPVHIVCHRWSGLRFLMFQVPVRRVDLET